MTQTGHRTILSPDFLRLSDLGREELFTLLTLAADMKRNPGSYAGSLAGMSVGCIFEKPSTRTRVSAAVAAHRLGMQAVPLSREELQLSRGEELGDTGRALSLYLDMIVCRTFSHTGVEELARAASVPVVNALTDSHHPCQALADLLTLSEIFGGLEGLRIAWIGDANSNIGHSLMEACALTGMSLAMAHPDGYGPDPEVATEAVRLGGEITSVTDPRDAVDGADAVYAETWVPMDKGLERDRREYDLRSYQVNDELMALARKDAVFLHALPAFRGKEVATETIDGPRSVVWQQAGNRLPTTQALMYSLASRIRDHASVTFPAPI